MAPTTLPLIEEEGVDQSLHLDDEQGEASVAGDEICDVDESSDRSDKSTKSVDGPVAGAVVAPQND